MKDDPTFTAYMRRLRFSRPFGRQLFSFRTRHFAKR